MWMLNTAVWAKKHGSNDCVRLIDYLIDWLIDWQVCAKDERIAQLQMREKELMSQLRTLDGLPVSEILGDLKDKQEQLFLQYISKLKPSDSTSAAASSSGTLPRLADICGLS